MYASHFGFHVPPFSITSDPSFLFFSAKHREAYDSLLYGIENRSGFIEIIGEVGCGKTTLCRKALADLPASVKTAYIFNTSLTEIQFLQTLLTDLAGTDASEAALQRISDLIDEHGRIIAQPYSKGNIWSRTVLNGYS